MLLDLRILLTAGLAAVLLLIGGFGLLAALRAPGKPWVGFPAGPVEITGSIGETPDTLTEADKAARPEQPEPIRAANIEKAEKTQAPAGTAEDKAKQNAAARPKPPARLVRQGTGANFKANNPFAFPFPAPDTNASSYADTNVPTYSGTRLNPP